MTGVFTFRTASVSDVGKVRKLNEDSVLARPEIGRASCRERVYHPV